MRETCKRRFEPVVTAIDCLLKEKENTDEVLLVAIDGRCASGKTTLSNYLETIYDCNVFHMDDFFLQGFQRTEERLRETGGNVDYERFYCEVIEPVLQRREILYRPYSCARGKMLSEKVVDFKKLNIVEGSYSMHPYFGNVYQLSFFLDIDERDQIENIRQRNGEEKLQRFVAEWIPMEEAYFSKYKIREKGINIFWKPYLTKEKTPTKIDSN
ncbi:MAG: uridine kinase [Suilimivivens sp.]